MTDKTLTPTEEILEELADIHWRRLRSSHNKRFMMFGPGEEWKRFKKQEAYLAECEEIRLLREYLGLPPEN